MAMVSLQAMYDDARHLLESGDANRVISIAQHMLAHYPDYLEAYRILGEASLTDGRVDQAAEAFGCVLRSDPEHIPAHAGLGVAYTRLGRSADAITEFETALDIKPDLPELRSQLFRLYTDAYGSDNAQFRLSRAGLARLYIKGHMLPQAIQELTAVVADHPRRLDARVALAETLWRDGQEDAAVEICGQILQEYPDALKPNLMLGYLLLASGDPDGQKFWAKARALDPHLGVARALFGTLPADTDEQPTIPAWDEQRWREEQQAQPTEQPVENAALAGAVAANSTADDLFNASWLSSIDTADAASTEQPAASVTNTSLSYADTDFLATLLAVENATPPPPTPQLAADEPADLGEIIPFSLDDLDQSGTAQREAAIPFSLDDATPPVEAPALLIPPAVPIIPPMSDDEPIDTVAFSLDDLGLDDLGLDDFEATAPVQQARAAVPPQPPVADDEPIDTMPFSLDDESLQPFSLADLGLSDEEIAALGQPGLGAASPEANEAPNQEGSDVPAELRPFSLDELDMDVAASDSSGSLPQSLQPFSLDDAMLSALDASSDSAEAPSAMSPLTSDDDPAPGTYGWQEPTSRLGTGFLKSNPPRQEEAEEGSIFAKLVQRRQAVEDQLPEPPAPPPVRDDEIDMSLFSLDDVPLYEDVAETSPPPQVPTSTAPPAVNAIEAAEAELTPFSLADLGLSEEEIAALGLSSEPATEPTQALPAAPDTTFSMPNLPAVPLAAPDTAFSMPNLPDEPVAAQPVDDEPVLVPFSLAELGLSEEEIAALGLGETATKEVPVAPEDAVLADAAAMLGTAPDLTPIDEEADTFDLGLDSLADLATGQPPTQQTPSAPQSAPQWTEPSTDEPELKPFSLSELGLSAEEIASLGLEDPLDDAPPVIDPSGLGLSVEEIEAFDLGGGFQQPATTPNAPPQPDLPEDAFDFSTIASLDDFAAAPTGDQTALSDANAFDFSGLDTMSPAANIPPVEASGGAAKEDMPQPFSLADLGLTDEEVAAFDVPSTANNQRPDAAASVEQLLEMGRIQGYVDINDIITVVDDPVGDADRIEEIGQLLHQAGIEIRDGDEVIDMDEGEDADEEFELFPTSLDDPLVAPAAEAPELTPFSLADLGLSDEEIASLGLDVVAETQELHEPTAPPVPEPAAESEILTPFSLADLGLSDEEIASLGIQINETATPASAEAPPITSPVEPAPNIPTTAEVAPPASDDDDFLASLDSLGDMAADLPQAPPAVPPVDPALARPGLSSEDKAALVEKKGLVSSMLADLRGSSSERNKPIAAEQPAAAEDTTQETFETLVPSIDEEPVAHPAAMPTQRVVAMTQPPADVSEGAELIDEYLKQLKGDPKNYSVRLAVARLGTQVGRRDVAIDQYKLLIKENLLLDQVVEDLVDLISESDERQYLQRLHRVLGDAYSKQGRFREAINEYSWTLSRA